MPKTPELSQYKEDKKKEADKNSKTPMLNNFGRNLTEMASMGLLDPVYGRDKEIEDIVNILNKRKKNNPILVGEPGVGKTVIVEALAQRIFDKKVEMWLLDKQIVEINLTTMVSGTKYRGEFEQRMESLVEEIEENPDIIVFIDEIHNIIGAGGTSGSLDASNIIKPALSRGTMKCIGATTSEEYKKYIESEGAFERRFQKVYVNEPGVDETIDLLMDIKFKYEDYHGVKYSKEIIKRAVKLSDKYINYRNFPDKAIDLIDEVGSMVKTLMVDTPDELVELEKLIKESVAKKKATSKEQDFESAARWRDKEKKYIKELEELKVKIQQDLKKNKIEVKIEHLAKIISSHTGIPVNKLTDTDAKKLKKLESKLESKIIGQHDAIQKVSESIQRARLGFGDPLKPISSFLFLGSTGVGKTYLAKMLAEELYDTSDSFIRIDMSEFEGSHSISKLIGSPPGYVGFENKGGLTEKIKNRPYSLVLFDEIEKAHPEVFNILLQILDDGKLTDSTGSEVNFKNTVIIMTSNVGTRNIVEDKRLGFNVDRSVLNNDKSAVIKEVEKTFKPEFVNRIDEKIIFNPLGKEEIKLIADIEMREAVNRIENNGYKIVYGDDVLNFLVENDFEKKYGARPIKRAIMNRILNPITRQIINGKIKEGSVIKFVVEKDAIIIKKVKENAKNKS